MKTTFVPRLATASACALLLAACSGGGGSSPAPAAPSLTQPASTGRLSIQFASPAASVTSSRKRHFLGFDAQSVSISVNGGTPTIDNLSSCSTNMTGTAKVCTPIGVTAPAGSDTIAISDYDSSNASGNLIGSGVAQATVTAGQTTPVKISLDGIPVQIIMQLSNFVPPTGTATTITLTPIANDQNGYYIVGTYLDPIALTDNDTNNEITLSKTTITNSSDPVTISYSGKGSTPVIITGTNAANKQTGTVTITPGGKYGELAVANFSTGTPYCGADIYDANATGSLQPKATLRGGGDNDGCGNVAISPNGDVYETGPVGIFIWHGYTSGNVYAAMSSANANGGLHFDSAGNMYVDSSDNTNPYEVSVEIYAPPFNGLPYPKSTVEIPSQFVDFTNNGFAGVSFRSHTDKNGELWMPGSSGIDEFAIINGPTYRKAGIAYGTTLKSVNNFAFGPSDEMWVCDGTANQVVRVNSGATTFDDHAAIITGQYVTGCNDIAVDSQGEVYVLVANNVVNVFAKTATGSALPVRSLQLNSGPALGHFALLN